MIAHGEWSSIGFGLCCCRNKLGHDKIYQPPSKLSQHCCMVVDGIGNVDRCQWASHWTIGWNWFLVFEIKFYFVFLLQILNVPNAHSLPCQCNFTSTEIHFTVGVRVQRWETRFISYNVVPNFIDSIVLCGHIEIFRFFRPNQKIQKKGKRTKSGRKHTATHIRMFYCHDRNKHAWCIKTAKPNPVDILSNKMCLRFRKCYPSPRSWVIVLCFFFCYRVERKNPLNPIT